MKLFTTNLNHKLNYQLQQIEIETDNIIEKSQKASFCVTNALKELKAFILEYTFSDEMEEILFFKEIKPEIFSKSIFHDKIEEIESLRPVGSYEAQEKYLKERMEELTHFFSGHKEFYQYYRKKSTHLDYEYFTRSKNKTKSVDIDENFSIKYDYTIAKIIAYDQLEVYLKAELEKIILKMKNTHVDHLGILSNIKWTGSKKYIMELVYALCLSGMLNDGNCEISELSSLFEEMFDVRFKDGIYRGFQDIKLRSNPTKFIDLLKEVLLRKINEDYE